MSYNFRTFELYLNHSDRIIIRFLYLKLISHSLPFSSSAVSDIGYAKLFRHGIFNTA